ncbi:DUF4097 family beta strand repeat-containing protein [Saccharopolyspora gloriosae]|uniref:DUF4097 family beta strand repeat-containing protein n=1 Tax=Saccharopolyspora gloriosae TaxID=455344 RepID=UPI001FB7E390|nr:DUF4097 family beta strand repeat-containing protein [Saccharopolyspora gloriosae]
MVRTGLAVAGASCLLIAGTVVSWGWGGQSGRESVTPLSGITEVRLAESAGEVRIEYRPGARAEVREQVRDWLGGDDGTSHRVEGGALVLAACGADCSVDYEVTLPAPVPVTGTGDSGGLEVAGMKSVDVETSAGSVRVSDVAGPVRVRGSAGGVELRDVDGDVDVTTGSGGIDGEDLGGGNITARADTGTIDLELTGPRVVRATTGTGGIGLEVPDEAYRVDSDTGTGSQDIDVTTDPNSPRRLELSTGTGSIEVDHG